MAGRVDQGGARVNSALGEVDSRPYDSRGSRVWLSGIVRDGAQGAPRLVAAAVCLLGIVFPVSASRSQSPTPSIRGLASVPATNAFGQVDLKGFEARWLEKHPDPPLWLSIYRLTSPGVDDAATSIIPSELDGLDSGSLDDSSTGPEWDPFTVRTSVEDKEATGLKALSAKGERWHLLRFDSVAVSRPLDARLKAFGQIPMSPAPPRPRPPCSMSRTSRVGAESGGFEVGAQYTSLGKRLDRVVSGSRARKDQEGSEVWLARRFGLVRLRVSQSELADNVDRNPVLPRRPPRSAWVTSATRVPERRRTWAPRRSRYR
jgi:hypothetical protein